MLFSYVASILCIDRYSCLLKPSYEAMSINVGATARINLDTAATCQKPSNAYFDVHVALVHLYFEDVIFLFSMLWLERLPKRVFTNSKYRNDTLQDQRCSLTFFLSLSMDAWSSLKRFAWLSCQHMAFIHAYLFKKQACVEMVNFYLKSVKFLFFVQFINV